MKNQVVMTVIVMKIMMVMISPYLLSILFRFLFFWGGVLCFTSVLLC